MNDTNGGLWKSDGTTNGTVFLMPGQMGQLIRKVANKLFFQCSCWNAFGPERYNLSIKLESIKWLQVMELILVALILTQ